ncbi:hypothetical protein KJ596_00540 [Patescibacteria group bacterium]|nr:hypothetical protein [Patescibacteria group bacterium]MBU1867942.1 hypothetical protein [Patescibacteria group bacterium]
MSPELKKAVNPKNNNPETPGRNWAKLLLNSLIVSCFLLSGLQIYLTNKTAVLGEEIGTQEQLLTKLHKEVSSLGHRIREGGALSYIENKARNDLKMVNANQHIIYLSPEFFASVNP